MYKMIAVVEDGGTDRFFSPRSCVSLVGASLHRAAEGQVLMAVERYSTSHLSTRAGTSELQLTRTQESDRETCKLRTYFGCMYAEERFARKTKAYHHSRG